MISCILLDLKFKRYKYIVNVVLGEQHGAGVKMGTRCIWDAEADTYAYDSFLNVRYISINSLHILYILLKVQYILYGYSFIKNNIHNRNIILQN